MSRTTTDFPSYLVDIPNTAPTKFWIGGLEFAVYVDTPQLRELAAVVSTSRDKSDSYLRHFAKKLHSCHDN